MSENNGIERASTQADENLLSPSEVIETPPEEPQWTPEETAPIEAGFSATTDDPAMFQSYSQSGFQQEIRPPERIPHFGHLGILILIAAMGWVAAGLLTVAAVHFHVFGAATLRQASNDIHYTLGSMAAIYLFTFGGCLAIFPLLWHKGFFAGLQWNGGTALRVRKHLFYAAFLCFVLALVDEVVLPGPTEAPIDKLFQTPMAAWLLFAFGVTFAPFFEEIAFRGFLLPALATAADWFNEQASGEPARPLGENGHPQWSMPAMIVASVLTSIPFALMHAEQTGYSLGPFVLLVCVSLVLCWTRLATRSLAASVLVHSCYNFLLFSLMLLGTGGFRHMEKM